MLTRLLDALTDRIAAGGTASAVSCSEHFSHVIPHTVGFDWSEGSDRTITDPLEFDRQYGQVFTCSGDFNRLAHDQSVANIAKCEAKPRRAPLWQLYDTHAKMLVLQNRVDDTGAL